MRFHRPDSGLGLNDKAVAAIRAARKLESKIPLWSVEADNDLLSDRDQNEAYLAAKPGEAYAVYFPARKSPQSKITLDLADANGEMAIHWIDIDTGEWGPTSTLQGGDSVEISPPGRGNWGGAIAPK